MSKVVDPTQRWLGNSNPATSVRRSRGFTVTVWTDAFLEILKSTNPHYMCWAPETCPDTGKFHWQTYVYYDNPRQLSTMGKMTRGEGRIFKSLGTPEDNRQYCMGPYRKNGKDKPYNPDFQEIGECPKQGKRNDLEAFRDDIVAGKRGRDLSIDHLNVVAKYPRLEERLTYEEDELKAFKMYKDGIFPEVHLRWGPPGTGKTRFITEKFDSWYEPSIRKGGVHWWSRYRGQDVILIDEFDGQIPIRDFLRLIDIYPFCLETKGGHVWRLATKIYITSNTPMEEWYPGEAHQIEKIRRRFTSITYVGPDQPSISA